MLKSIHPHVVADYYQRNGMFDRKWKEEADLLHNSLELCAMLGAVAVRMAFTTRDGQSDLIVCYQGRFFAAELKAADGIASALQHKFIEEIEAAGGKGALVYTLRNLFELLTQ